jgi:tRNA threonylcarbamoyladenosine biosynthesis protein TsaB
MIILTIRTDKPEAEIGIYKGLEQLDYCQWLAHRQLAETIHQKIKELLSRNDMSLEHIDGLCVFKGPGSFTGLRIGASVANALATSLQVPVVSRTGESWLIKGAEALKAGENEEVVSPDYGSPPKTTTQKK